MYTKPCKLFLTLVVSCLHFSALSLDLNTAFIPTQVFADSAIRRDNLWFFVSLPTKAKHSPGQKFQGVKRLSEESCEPNPTDSHNSSTSKSTWPLKHACTAKSGMTWEESGSSREENPQRRRKVFLSIKTNFRSSCDQLTTKKLSSLILQPNELSNSRLWSKASKRRYSMNVAELSKGQVYGVYSSPVHYADIRFTVCLASLHFVQKDLSILTSITVHKRKTPGNINRHLGQVKYFNQLH